MYNDLFVDFVAENSFIICNEIYSPLEIIKIH